MLIIPAIMCSAINRPIERNAAVGSICRVSAMDEQERMNVFFNANIYEYDY